MSNLKIYKASAGSGKTYTLALEYIKELLLHSSDGGFRSILAVTFTKDATGEMKDRILAELYGLAFDCKDSKGFMESLQEALIASGRAMKEDAIRAKALEVLQTILHDYSRLYITTIDSFFQRILRNLARELGKGSKFNLEMNSTKVLSEAVRAVIEKANENPQVLEWLTLYIEDKLDEGVNWRIDKEVLDFSKCIFDEFFQEHEQDLKKQIEGNPKVFAELKTQHQKMQKGCKDFFRSAWTKISRQMDERNLQLSDFAKSGAVLNYIQKLSDGDFVGAKMGSTVEKCMVDPDKWSAAKTPHKNEINAMAASEWMKMLNDCQERLRTYNTSRMVTRNLHQLGLIWDITSEIAEQNAENNRFMLADTALFLNRMIDDSDAPFVYEKIGAEIRHVMIDEFQDTSRLQWSNFKALLSEILSKNYFSLIVGDVKQSIYRWRNGDWRILNRVEEELHAQSEKLEFNFRSEKEIIAFNNNFFTQAAGHLHQKYAEAFPGRSSSPFKETYSPENVDQQSKKSRTSGYVSVGFIPDKTEESGYDDLVLDRLFEQIQLLQEKEIPAHEICILTRTNREIIRIAEYLSARKVDSPELAAAHYLSIVSNEAFQLKASPCLKIIIEALRVIADPDNPVHRAQLEFYLKDLSSPGSRWTGFEPATTNDLSRMPLFELIGHLYRLFHLDKIEGQSKYLFAFYDAVNNYLKENPADIPAFLQYWTDELQSKSIPAGTAVEGIRAMTIHKSKGLQFHTVLLPYCNWPLSPKNTTVWCSSKQDLFDLELLPVKYSQAMYDTVFVGEYEEETIQSWMDNLNVLYVAFTRAEHNLLVLGKYKKKLEVVDHIKTVSDLLQFCTPELEGSYIEEDMTFEKGELAAYSIKVAGEKTDNLLKQLPAALPAAFVAYPFSPDKSIFKQSNKSREFIKPESTQESYVAYGNIMHDLFAHIDTLDDIENAVDRLLFDGMLLPQEREAYIDKVKESIRESNAEDWFSDKYRRYNESAIILKEGNTVTTRRPDRVLQTDQSTIIIDYKFGEERKVYHQQVNEYASLFRQMNYPNVEAYLWYIEQKKIVNVSSI